jgi:hypothetical protein
MTPDTRDGGLTAAITPVVMRGIIGVHSLGPVHLPVMVDGRALGWITAAVAEGEPRQHFVDLAGAVVPGVPAELTVGSASLRLRLGGWSGAVAPAGNGMLKGHALDETQETASLRVVLIDRGRVCAEAITDPARGGAFALELPPALRLGPRRRATVAIAGSDHVLEGGTIAAGGTRSALLPAPRRRAARPVIIAIRTATPDLSVAHEWGDHHFAVSLARAFERRGWHARVLMRDSPLREAETADVTLSLRGRQAYAPVPGRVNLMWVISHPDRLPDAECEGYDHVFVASDRYAATMARALRVPVSVLHQATDPAVFREPVDRQVGRDCVFVGNSRLEWRTMVRWCVEQGLPLALWGGRWEGLVPPEMLRGQHVPNAELHRLYAAAAIVLNDHWETMRTAGFLSNRLFDASAVAAPLITDAVAGLSEVFGETIPIARDGAELAAQVKAILRDPAPALARARAAQRLVLERHTFDHRAGTIIETVEQFRAVTRGTGHRI